MHLSVAHELGVFQSWDHAEDPFLLGELEIGLEAHQVVQRACQVVLPQLDDCIGASSRARIADADRAHRAKRQRIDASFGDDLHRQAALKEMARLTPPVIASSKERSSIRSACSKRAYKGQIFVLCKGTVDVIPFVLFAVP